MAPVILKQIDEPKEYPVFYLASIVYRTASDWTVWIGGHKLTPTTNKGEVTVAALSPDQAKFVWKPAYMSALIQRHDANKFSPLTKVKNRLTPSDTVTFDSRGGAIGFTLRPNQSFDAAYLSTFEGKMMPSTPPDMTGVPVASPGEKLSDAAKAVMDDMTGSSEPPPPADQPDPTATPAPSAGSAAQQGTLTGHGDTINTLQNLLKSPNH